MPLLTRDMPIPVLRDLLGRVCGDLIARLEAGEQPWVVAPSSSRPEGDHWHSFPELFIQLAGRSRFQTPQGELSVASGSCLLMSPLLAHQEQVDRKAGAFANLVIWLTGRRLTYHLALPIEKDPNCPGVMRPDFIEDDTLVTAVACLAGLARTREADATSRGFFLAICGMIRATLLAAPTPGIEGSDRVRLARGIIDYRLGSTQFSLDALAEWVGCHPDHLTRIFRRETGETLVAYIQRQRLERARALMVDSRLRVRDVARLVGFADPAYFCRVWRRRYGSSPRGARSAKAVKTEPVNRERPDDR